jgi:hypothetical protein
MNFKFSIRIVALLFFVFCLNGFGKSYKIDPRPIGFVKLGNAGLLTVDSLKTLVAYTDRLMTLPIANAEIHLWSFNPKQGIAHFVCLEKTDKLYKIQIDSGKVAYIANTSKVQFLPLESGLQGFSLTIDVNSFLKDSPSAESQNISTKEDMSFDIKEVVEVKGELWAYVAPNSEANNMIKQSVLNVSGWVKIKAKGKLLVSIHAN